MRADRKSRMKMTVKLNIKVINENGDHARHVHFIGDQSRTDYGWVHYRKVMTIYAEDFNPKKMKRVEVVGNNGNVKISRKADKEISKFKKTIDGQIFKIALDIAIANSRRPVRITKKIMKQAINTWIKSVS